MATWFLPEDAIYVLSYEYKKHGKWVQGQLRGFPTSKAATEAWHGMLTAAERRAGNYRKMAITAVNVYKE